MSPDLKRFLNGVITLTVLMAILMAVVFGFFLQNCFHPAFPFILLFFSGFSMFIFFRMEKASQKEFAKFVQARMAMTILRLFVYIVVAVLYIAFIKKGIPCFITLLGILYLAYSLLEVYLLTYDHKKGKPAG